MIKPGTKGGSYGDVSVCRCIGHRDFSEFHRTGWRYWAQTSSLSEGVTANSIEGSGCRVRSFVEVVLSVVKKNPAPGARKHDPKKSNCNDSCGPGDRLGSDGQSDPGFDLAALD